MANQAARQAGATATFLCRDAESMHFDEPFDFLWSIESISHYQDVPRFFSNAAMLLKPSGSFALTDWFKQKSLPPREHRKFLRPIEEGMLVELNTILDYETWLAAVGLNVRHREILNRHTAQTWDFCLDIIKDRALWQLAARHGPECSVSCAHSRLCVPASLPASSSTASWSQTAQGRPDRDAGPPAVPEENAEVRPGDGIALSTYFY
jgi:SAM-dependent methyltransferase